MERDPSRERSIVGLCEECRFAKRIRNTRGSEFVLCGRSESDASYPRYPRLPVERCPGYERGGE